MAVKVCGFLRLTHRLTLYHPSRAWPWGTRPCWRNISDWLQPPSSLQPVGSQSPAPDREQTVYKLLTNKSTEPQLFVSDSAGEPNRKQLHLNVRKQSECEDCNVCTLEAGKEWEKKNQFSNMSLCTCKGVKATLELVPDDLSLTVDLPPYVMLCFCSVRCKNKTFIRPYGNERSLNTNV